MKQTTSYFEHYQTVNDLSPCGRRSHWQYLDRTIGRYLPSDTTSSIVDIGCGAGIAMEWLKSCGYTNVIGVDVDEEQVDFARNIGLDCHHSLHVTEWLDRLEEVDFVIMKDVLEHVPEAETGELLHSVCSVLRPGGQVYVAVPNANSAFAARWRYIDATHQRSYTEPVLLLEMDRAGFEVVDFRGDDVWVAGSVLGHVKNLLRAVFRLFRRAEAIAEFGREGLRMPLSLNLVVIGKRRG